MNHNIYRNLLSIIEGEKSSFQTLVDADNTLGLNVSVDDIISYLDFFNGNQALANPLVGNILITEGDILSILKIINDVSYHEGEFTLFINNDNIGTITYLVSRANKIYQDMNLNVKIIIDYSDNYNKYLNELVSVIGSKNFTETAKQDFSNCNQIIV